MRRKSYYETILSLIRNKQDIYRDRILCGNLNIEDYKGLTGRLSGLIESEELIMKAYKEMFENISEDEKP